MKVMRLVLRLFSGSFVLVLSASVLLMVASVVLAQDWDGTGNGSSTPSFHFTPCSVCSTGCPSACPLPSAPSPSAPSQVPAYGGPSPQQEMMRNTQQQMMSNYMQGMWNLGAAIGEKAKREREEAAREEAIKKAQEEEAAREDADEASRRREAAFQQSKSDLVGSLQSLQNCLDQANCVVNPADQKKYDPNMERYVSVTPPPSPSAPQQQTWSERMAAELSDQGKSATETGKDLSREFTAAGTAVGGTVGAAAGRKELRKAPT
jgi:hypothetical protein